jgi:hypothetical protein
LELQATVMGMGQRNADVWNAVKITGDELWTAFKNVFHMAGSLRDAVVAVEFSRSEAQRLAA